VPPTSQAQPHLTMPFQGQDTLSPGQRPGPGALAPQEASPQPTNSHPHRSRGSTSLGRRRRHTPPTTGRASPLSQFHSPATGRHMQHSQALTMPSQGQDTLGPRAKCTHPTGSQPTANQQPSPPKQGQHVTRPQAQAHAPHGRQSFPAQGSFTPPATGNACHTVRQGGRRPSPAAQGRQQGQMPWSPKDTYSRRLPAPQTLDSALYKENSRKVPFSTIIFLWKQCKNLGEAQHYHLENFHQIFKKSGLRKFSIAGGPRLLGARSDIETLVPLYYRQYPRPSFKGPDFNYITKNTTFYYKYYYLTLP